MPLALWLSFWLRLDQPLSDQWLQSGPWMVAVLWIVGLPLLLVQRPIQGPHPLRRQSIDVSIGWANGRVGLGAIGCWCAAEAAVASSELLDLVLGLGDWDGRRFAVQPPRCVLQVLQSVNKLLHAFVIYGAGAAGSQLAASLRHSGTHHLVAFVDDDPELWGRSIGSVEIKSPKHLEALATELIKSSWRFPPFKNRSAAALSMRFRSWVAQCSRCPRLMP